MRLTRDVALRTGIYLTAAISGLAVAYVLREWIHHFWDDPTPTDEKRSGTLPPPVTSDAEHASVQSLDTDEDAHTPSTSQTKSLPPLRIPPLLPLHSGAQPSFVAIDHSSMTNQTMSASSNGDDGAEEKDAAQSDTSPSDPLMDVMSPHPPRVITKRRSMRAHDLFAESHMSFSDLGSLVAPQNEPE